MASATERSLDSGHEESKFGTGAILGVAAPGQRAMGNATAGTAMGALLAMGLPPSTTAALMLAAFQQYGIQPGPLLFDRSADLVGLLLASLSFDLIFLLILNLPLVPRWAELLLIPRHYLSAGIALFCALGVYATSAAVSDLLLVLVIGTVGFLFRRCGFPLAPVMIEVILGPLAETSFRNALLSSGGECSSLIDSPITWVLSGLMDIVPAAAAYKHYNNRNRTRSALTASDSLTPAADQEIPEIGRGERYNGRSRCPHHQAPVGQRVFSLERGPRDREMPATLAIAPPI